MMSHFRPRLAAPQWHERPQAMMPATPISQLNGGLGSRMIAGTLLAVRDHQHNQERSDEPAKVAVLRRRLRWTDRLVTAVGPGTQAGRYPSRGRRWNVHGGLRPGGGQDDSCLG